ncbi:hypothetical protein K435DRAFT_783492 [Dendrothele bispora CBS 962.96]|uniref:Uncharacterized protein n=1 Tax=Dendrothele bispora (strain CBS 962.96) TaxID=1314807 RepID=A0A4S8L8Z7_DENBC|nr:hypothetical protein K435DRAFT_783492 [Dendrothele bispora CBS 962.96]
MPSHSRSSHSSSNHTQVHHTVPDIITYRLDEALVYVRPSTNYKEAISLAIKEYPSELGNISPRRITFTIQASMNGTRRTVRISESAWEKSISTMVKGEVIAIEILPEITITTSATVDAPPPKYIADKLSDSECSPTSTSSDEPRSPEGLAATTESTNRSSVHSRPSSPGLRQLCPSFKRVTFLSR